MQTFEYVITDEVGIHARPAGLLTKKAAGYDSKITITKGEKSVDGKRLIAVMGLGAKKGETVTVTVEGTDEELAKKELEQFFKENL